MGLRRDEGAPTVPSVLPLLAAVALAAAPPTARPAEGTRARDPRDSRDSIDRRREDVAKEIAALGAKLRSEIEEHDVAAVLAHVPESGLRCGNRVIPRERVARDLRNEGSWVHGVVFGGSGFRPPRGTAASLAELFKSAREVALAVSFQADPRAGPEGRPCLEFRAKDVATPGAPLCFERQGKAWWLVESLYPCG
jgi:hypothetical protein